MKLVLSFLALLAFAAGPAFAQGAPPTPLPASVLCATCQTSLSVTNSSSRVILPSTNPSYNAITLYNSGSKDAYFVQGDSTAVATTANVDIPAGSHVTVWVSGTYVAAITGGSDTTTLKIYQANGPIQLGQIGTGGGGSSGPCTAFGTTAGTCAEGNDSRIAGALQSSNNLSDVSSASTALANLAGAPLASPTFTGTPAAPTPGSSDNSTKLATTAYVKAQGYSTATGANPSATIGASAVNGSATTFMRSDAAPALPATLPALNGSLLTNLNATNLASGTVADARLSTNVPLKAASNIFTLAQQINTNTGSAPTALTGTLLQGTQADGVIARAELDSFAAIGAYTCMRADSTNASKSAVQANDVLCNFSAFGYGATGYSTAFRGSWQILASENWSDTAQGTNVVANCTANTTLTTAECARAKSNGFTIPTGSTYQINNVQITTGALSDASNIALLNAANIFTANQMVQGATTAAPSWCAQLSTDTIARACVGLDSVDGARFSAGPGASTARDTFLGRAGVGNWRCGAPDAAASQPCTWSAQNVVAGTTNTAGSLEKYVDSGGTGTGVSGGYEWDTHPAGSTGSSQNAAASKMTLASNGTLSTGTITPIGGVGFTIRSDFIFSSASSGPEIRVAAGNATTPLFQPNQNDTTTGLGGVSGHFAAIAGGVDNMDCISTACAFSTNASFATRLTIGNLTVAAGQAGDLGMTYQADGGTVPGAGYCAMRWTTGTSTGRKLVAYCGTGATPVTIVDNVGN